MNILSSETRQAPDIAITPIISIGDGGGTELGGDEQASVKLRRGSRTSAEYILSNTAFRQFHALRNNAATEQNRYTNYDI
jgi:hypothetical protein